MNLVVDGWLLRQQGHGMASFARTLVAGLADSAVGARTRVAIPEGSESVVPAGLAHRTLRSRAFGLAVVDEVLWQDRLGRHVRRHAGSDALIALAPFVSSVSVRRSLVVCHDLIPDRFPRYLGRFFYRRWVFNAQIRWLRNATCVVTDSVHTAHDLHARLGANGPPIVTIPLWTPLADAPAPSVEARRAAREKYQLPPRYWLYLGGYDYRKNVEFLIEVYGQATRSENCPPLVLAGVIPLNTRKPVCDVHGAVRRAGIASDRLRFPGYIEAADLSAVYAGAELFIYPSLAEGFGLPPVEAMSSGCPSIVADATSLPEVVTDPDYRFPVENAARLTEMLTTAARAPLRLNPGFDRRFYGHARGLGEYLRVIERVISGS